jgi:histidinol-phosphate aminotransferase
MSPSKGFAGFIRPDIAAIAPYQPGKRASEMRREAGLDRMIKLSSNESAWPPFPKAQRAIRAIASRLNRYPDSYSGMLRERVARHMDVSEQQVCLGNGSNELITFIAQAVLGPKDEAVFAWPSFVVYPIVSQLIGARAVKVPLDDGWRHDLPAMADAVTKKTRLLFVCNPNNPTGTIVSKDEVARLMEAVPEECLVVFDEAYFEYVDDPDFGTGMAYFDGERPVVVLRTFSKMYSLAGLRVGYGAFPIWLAEAIEKLREPFNVNMAAQIAAYYSLDEVGEVARRANATREGRQRIEEALAGLGVRYAPSQANFVCFAVDDGPAVFRGLISRGVIVRELGGTGMLRATVGTEEETETFIAALADALAELRGSGPR